MNRILFEVSDEPVNTLMKAIFRKLPIVDRRHIESVIAAVTNGKLTTAVRPFAFGGKIVHELYLDTEKLALFTKREKTGAIVSALIISVLADESKKGNHKKVDLSNQALMTHGKYIANYAKRWKYREEVTAFLRRLKALEDEWRHDYFPDIPDTLESIR